MTDRPILPEPDPTTGSDYGWQQPAGSPPPPVGQPYGFPAPSAPPYPAPPLEPGPLDAAAGLGGATPPAEGSLQYGYPAQPGYSSPYGYGYPNPYGYAAAMPQTSGRAIAVMVLGILSLTMCWLGLIPAIVAVAMATRARREIEQSGGRLTGLGMVTAGRITSWITIGFVGVLAVIVVLAVAFGNVDGSVSPTGPTQLPG